MIKLKELEEKAQKGGNKKGAYSADYNRREAPSDLA